MPSETHYWGEWFNLPKNTYARQFSVTFNWNDGRAESSQSGLANGMWYNTTDDGYIDYTQDDDGNPVYREDITQVFVEDMAFVGWSRSPVDVVDEHVDGERVVNLAVEDGAVVTLYAMWETQYLEMPVAQRKGFIFLGWSFERQDDFPHPGYNTKDKVKALRIGKTVGPLNDSDPIADRENYLIWKPSTHRRLNEQYELHGMWYPIVPTVDPDQTNSRDIEEDKEEGDTDATLYAMWYGNTPYVPPDINIVIDDNHENFVEARIDNNFENFIDIITNNNS